MKRLSILIPGLMLATAFPGLASTAGLVMGTPSTNVYVGNTLELIVGLFPEGNSVAGFQFDLLFPANLFQATGSVVEDGYFGAAGCCFSYTSIDNTNGIIAGISDVAFPGLTTLFDELVTVEFTAIAPGNATFSFQNAALSDDSGNSIPVSVFGANASAVPVPTPEPAAALLFAPALGLVVWLGARGRKARLPANPLII